MLAVADRPTRRAAAARLSPGYSGKTRSCSVIAAGSVASDHANA